jgi:hypothetical protein
MDIRNISVVKTRNVTLRIAISILYSFLFILLTSCLEVKQGLNINQDGSGDARLEISVQKEWAPQIISRLKQNVPKGWNIVEEKEQDGKHTLIFGNKFKDISELSDDESRYTLSIQTESFLKKSYSLEIEQIKTADAPFPYEFTINIPGSITETNGIKVSSNQVKWNLFGIKRGTKLVLKSSGFLFPSAVIYVALGFGVILLTFIAVKVLKRSKATVSADDIPSKKIFCTQCGKENLTTATFCTSCGEKLQ